MSTEPRPSVDALLARMDRVRSLARRLVRDAAEADDLVQEAVTAALSRPTTVHGDGDGWIAATLRNLARDRARGSGRRARREKTAARPEAGGGDTSDFVANAERQRDVVEAVLSLEDPYRETLLMRFFEDLPPREIVKRTGRTPDAVKKHIDRGLAQLRAKLEKRYGGRGQWAVALLPITGHGTLTKLGVAGTSKWASSSAVRAAAGLLLALGVGVPSYLVWRGTAGTSRETETSEVARVARRDGPPALAPVALPSDGRATATGVDHDSHGTHEEVSTTLTVPPASLVTQRIKLVALDGSPFANAEVEWTWAPQLVAELGEQTHTVAVETDSEGRATIPGPTFPSLTRGPWRVNGGQLSVAGEDESGGEALLVLAPSIRLAGRVTDPDGRPFPGAKVTVWADVRVVPGFPAGVSRTLGARQIGGGTDADGRFSFDDVPTDPAFRITVSAEGRRGGGAPMPPVDDLGLELSVGEKPADGRWITGTVLEANGAPAAGAMVRFLFHEDEADAQGRFQLKVPYDPANELITAEAADGRFVAVASPVDTDVVQEADRDGNLDDAVVLRLPAAMPSLRGRLVDAAGESVVGHDVLVFDGTRVGSSNLYFETGGDSGKVKTDDGGRFVIERVLDRAYTLRFIDTDSMLVHDAEGLEPGPSEHTIVLPADAFIDLLRGHVVDVFGDPVVDAQISLRADTNPSTSSIVGHRFGRRTWTDQDGRFVIAHAPWRHLSIAVSPRRRTGDGCVSTPIGERRPDGTIELEVDLRCLVNVSIDRVEVTQIRAFDRSGERLNVTMYRSGVTAHHTRVSRTPAGHFPLFDVSQRAVTLVLYGTSGEIQRVPIRLATGGQNDLTL